MRLPESTLTVLGFAALFFVYVGFSVSGSPPEDFAGWPAFGSLTEQVNLPPESASAILFTGDILLARDIEKLMSEHGPDYPFEGVAYIHEAAVVFGNFEAALPANHIPTKEYSTVFSVARDNLDGLVSSGFTHLSLANNHSYDFASSGFKETKQALKQRGFTVLGDPQHPSANDITYLSTPAGVVSVIALSAITEEVDIEVWIDLITRASYGSEIQMVYIHWGTEYELLHSKKQEQIAKRLVSAGADVIIGHHPHVIQDIVRIENALVFYSLGNFIFDQYFSNEVQQGLSVQFEEKDNQWGFSLLPVSSLSKRGQPTLATSDERAKTLATLANTATSTHAQAILDGFIPLEE